jgi:hypothetical protein
MSCGSSFISAVLLSTLVWMFLECSATRHF